MKIAAWGALQAHAADHVRRELPKIRSHELVAMIFEHPDSAVTTAQRGAMRSGRRRRLSEAAGVHRVLPERSASGEKPLIHFELMRRLIGDQHTVEREPECRRRPPDTAADRRLERCGQMERSFARRSIVPLH